MRELYSKGILDKMAIILTSEVKNYKTIRSKSIYLDPIPATKAKLSIVTTSDVSQFILGLSNNGGESFEEVENQIEYNFQGVGNEVQYQIWGKQPGSIIKSLTVKVN